jgi:hypothetical protein
MPLRHADAIATASAFDATSPPLLTPFDFSPFALRYFFLSSAFMADTLRYFHYFIISFISFFILLIRR